jgi:hypothetical protein
LMPPTHPPNGTFCLMRMSRANHLNPEITLNRSFKV